MDPFHQFGLSSTLIVPSTPHARAKLKSSRLERTSGVEAADDAKAAVGDAAKDPQQTSDGYLALGGIDLGDLHMLPRRFARKPPKTGHQLATGVLGE
jgi:hypothetical protein